MKNRYFSVIAALLMVQSLASCGNETSPVTPVDTTNAITTVQETKEETSLDTSSVSEPVETTAKEEIELSETSPVVTTDTETTTEITEETPAEDVSVKVPEYHPESEKYDVPLSDGSEANYFSGKYNYIVIDNSDVFPELSKALSSKDEELIDTYMKQRDELVSSAIELYEDAPEMLTGEYAFSIYCDVDNIVVRSDDSAFSVLYGEEGYGGGVHGWEYQIGINYDSKTGKELTLSDICTDIPRLIDVLAKKLETEYPELSGVKNLGSGKELLTSVYGDELQGGVRNYEDGTEYDLPKFNYIFTPDGVTFIANTYELGCYAEGPQQVTVLYSEEPGLFNEKYVRIGDDFSILTSAYFNIGFEENGKSDKITMDFDYDESDWTLKGIMIKGLGQEKYIEYTQNSDFETYYFKKMISRIEGKYYFCLYNLNGEVIAEAEF